MNDRQLGERFLADASPAWMKGDAKVPLDFGLTEEAGRLDLTITANATRAFEGLWAKLEQGAIAAFDAGKDFAVGPMTHEGPDPFAVRDIFAPQTISVECKAGPVDRGWEAPAGWRVYQRPDDWGKE